MKNNIKCCYTLLSLSNKIVNNHRPIDYTNDNNINNNTLTWYQSKPNPKPILFSSKSSKNSVVKFADRLILEILIVIYKQSQKSQIVKEKSIKQGQERLCKQY